MNQNEKINAIDALLPQTQCQECGYAGCRPYAQAIAADQAPIDRCPPGGVNVLKALGDLLKVDPTPYIPTVIEQTRQPAVAIIQEAECIGCTKCIQACPVDAIIGSAKTLHTVIEHECTGCGLCIEPCPVDCIDIQTLPTPVYDPLLARQRFKERQIRLIRSEQSKQQLYREKRRLAVLSTDQKGEKQAKQNYILQALARQKAKRNGHE